MTVSNFSVIFIRFHLIKSVVIKRCWRTNRIIFCLIYIRYSFIPTILRNFQCIFPLFFLRYIFSYTFAVLTRIIIRVWKWVDNSFEGVIYYFISFHFINSAFQYKYYILWLWNHELNVIAEKNRRRLSFGVCTLRKTLFSHSVTVWFE